MILEEEVESKNKLAKVAGYIAPFRQPKKEVQISQAYQLAVQNPEVRQAFAQATPEQQKALIQRLAYHVQAARRGTRLLRYSAGLVDTVDKLAIPAEDAAEGSVLGYPIGIALKLAQMPIKALHSLHYAVKAREPTAPIRDAIWETASLVVPGHVLDLTNRYAARAVTYVPHHAAKGFITELRGKNKKKKGFIDIAEGFRSKGQSIGDYEDYHKLREQKQNEERAFAA
jgi:hypothetical protein